MENRDYTVLDAMFDFKVGDIVVEKLMQVGPDDRDALPDFGWGGREEVEMRAQIVERHIQQCPGGVQKHYTVRFVTRKGSIADKYFRLNEIELSLSEPFQPRKKVAA